LGFADFLQLFLSSLPDKRGWGGLGLPPDKGGWGVGKTS